MSVTKSLQAVHDRLHYATEDELAAVYDVLGTIIAEIRGWTKRCDDAKRIPDVILDFQMLVGDMQRLHER